jgi:hypothetical protein
MGKIWKWFFGRKDEMIGHTNSRTWKGDPKTLNPPPNVKKSTSRKQ